MEALQDLLQQFQRSKEAISQGFREKTFDWAKKDDANKKQQKKLINLAKKWIKDLNKQYENNLKAAKAGHTPDIEILRSHYFDGYTALKKLNEAIDANIGGVNIPISASPDNKFSKQVMEHGGPVIGFTAVDAHGRYQHQGTLTSFSAPTGNKNQHGNIDRGRTYKNDKT